MTYYAIEDKNVYTGFHCGALGGLDANKREEAKLKMPYSYPWDSYTRLLDRIPNMDARTREKKPVCKAGPGSSLRDCLLGTNVSDLRNIANGARIELLGASRKADLVELLFNKLPKQVERFDEVVSNLGLDAIFVVERLLEGELVGDGRQWCTNGMGSFPFAFLCNKESKLTWFMPLELREAFAKVDVHKYSERQETYAAVARLLSTYVVLGGIVPVQEVLDVCGQSVPGGLFSEEQAMRAVRELTRGFRSPFKRWEHEGATYIALDAYPVSVDDCEYCDFSDESSRDYRLESMRGDKSYASLVSCHQQALPRAGMDDLLHKSVSEYVYGLPCVQSLVSYFDLHVPSGENEYTFADRMVDELICNFLFRRHTLLTELERLTRQGWYLCEGFNTAPMLTSLVVGLYRGLPRWELNGWSEAEYIDMQGYPSLIGESLLVPNEFALAS